MHCFFFHFFLFFPLSFRARALKKVAAAAAAAGVAWGLPVGSKERAAEVFEQGATFINLGGDFGAVMKEAPLPAAAKTSSRVPELDALN